MVKRFPRSDYENENVVCCYSFPSISRLGKQLSPFCPTTTTTIMMIIATIFSGNKWQQQQHRQQNISNIITGKWQQHYNTHTCKVECEIKIMQHKWNDYVGFVA